MSCEEREQTLEEVTTAVESVFNQLSGKVKYPSSPLAVDACQVFFPLVSAGRQVHYQCDGLLIDFLAFSQ